jgi:uncharacterized protein YdhG (YjbR/CyaY superfamily)
MGSIPIPSSLSCNAKFILLFFFKYQKVFLLVTSKAETVENYLAELTDERKSAIVKLREITKKSLPDFKESMRFGMPTYDGNGQVFAFASQKNYVSVYVNNEKIVQTHKQKLGKASYGKNCIRYRQLSDMNFDELKKVIAETYHR